MKRASQARRQKQKRTKPKAAPRKPLSLVNPPTTPSMSVKTLAELTGESLKTTYMKVAARMFPSIRLGRGKIAVLTEPTLAILRGERPPGHQVAARPDGSVAAPAGAP